ncbi:hypothetical protein ABZP36_000197 [Zizania latifolia]
MVQMPPVCFRVYYFPQGHAEHANGGGAEELTAAIGPRTLPAHVLCCIVGVQFLADPETNEAMDGCMAPAHLGLAAARGGGRDPRGGTCRAYDGWTPPAI